MCNETIEDSLKQLRDILTQLRDILTEQGWNIEPIEAKVTNSSINNKDLLLFTLFMALDLEMNYNFEEIINTLPKYFRDQWNLTEINFCQQVQSIFPVVFDYTFENIWSEVKSFVSHSKINIKEKIEKDQDLGLQESLLLILACYIYPQDKNFAKSYFARIFPESNFDTHQTNLYDYLIRVLENNQPPPLLLVAQIRSKMFAQRRIFVKAQTREKSLFKLLAEKNQESKDTILNFNKINHSVLDADLELLNLSPYAKEIFQFYLFLNLLGTNYPDLQRIVTEEWHLSAESNFRPSLKRNFYNHLTIISLPNTVISGTNIWVKLTPHLRTRYLL